MVRRDADNEKPCTRLHKFLLARCDDIVAAWMKGARELSPARLMSSRALSDHVPQILERIAGLIEARLAGQPASLGDGPKAHAIERLARGYSLEEVIKEYTLLRHCVLDLWEQETGGIVHIGELRGFEDALEYCIGESAARFQNERERTLNALDQLSEAAFGSSDLDSFLKQLLQWISKTMEVVDAGAILLQDGDVLRVRAILGVEEVADGVSVSVGEGFAGKIAAAAHPAFLGKTAGDGFLDNEVLRNAQVCALYGVPLMVEDKVIGVAQMGSCTASEFSKDDKLLFGTMVSRALLVIQSAQLQADLRESSARNEAILDAALDCVISMNGDGYIVGWNHAAERTFGYSRAEVIGADMADIIIPPSYRAAHRAGVNRYLTTGEQRYFNRRIEFDGLRRDGSEFPVELTITRVAGDKPLFTGFVRDITDEKKAEHERSRLVEEVTRARDVQRFLSDASKHLAESLDYEATLASIAQLTVPRMADWCAVDMIQEEHLHRVSVAHTDPLKTEFVQELIHRYPLNPGELRGIPQVVRTGHSELVSQITDEFLTEIARDEAHLQILRTLGLKSYIITPVSIRGTVLGAITVVSAESGRQYSEADVLLVEELALRVATAIENARLYSEAQAAVRAREDVLAVVSHDLRNPLNTISMNANVLRMTPPSSSAEGEQCKQIDMILRAVGRMKHLIGDLLDIASIQAKRLSLEASATKLVPLLCEAFETYEPVAKEAGISLRQEFAVGRTEVRCDHNRLIQVLSNLLGNAIKFCSVGDVITLGAARRDDEVVISVADTGPGIPTDELAEIFNPYWTAAREGTRGTGLGLYITKGIVEAHNGRIWVKSQPGIGTTFFFTVPTAG